MTHSKVLTAWRPWVLAALVATLLLALVPLLGSALDIASPALAAEGEAAAAASGEIGGYEARIAADPKDFDARLEIAMALFGGGERKTAVDHLLEILSHDLNWNDDAARKQLLEFFEAMGPTDPLTLSARRRLSSLIFS